MAFGNGPVMMWLTCEEEWKMEAGAPPRVQANEPIVESCCLVVMLFRCQITVNSGKEKGERLKG